MDLDEALRAGNDDAVDDALDRVKLEQGPTGLAEALHVVVLQKRAAGVEEHELTGWQYRRSAALEAAAVVDGVAPRDAAARALEAATLARDVLNDGEGATRALVLALRLAADDEVALRSTTSAAGGHEPAIALLEKAAKKAKGDDGLQGRLRRGLARLYEVLLHDKEKAFFEALKAARKVPEGLFLDDVYRLALDITRLDEAAAFFQSIADEPAVPARAKATALNKLGALQEAKKDKNAAFSAYVASLKQHETKAARKKAERLREELELAIALPDPVEAPSIPPTPAPAEAATVVRSKPPPDPAPAPPPTMTPMATPEPLPVEALPVIDLPLPVIELPLPVIELPPLAPPPPPDDVAATADDDGELPETNDGRGATVEIRAGLPRSTMLAPSSESPPLPSTGDDEGADLDVVEESLARAMNPDMPTHVGPPPLMPGDLPSIPPPLPADEDEDPIEEFFAAGDAPPGTVGPRPSRKDKSVFTDEIKLPTELSADDAEVVSEERLDPALRALAEDEDSRSTRTERPEIPVDDAPAKAISVSDVESVVAAAVAEVSAPPVPADDEASVLAPRVDVTVDQRALQETQTLPPAAPALASELLADDDALMPPPTSTSTPVPRPVSVPPTAPTAPPPTLSPPELLLEDEASRSTARPTTPVESPLSASPPPSSSLPSESGEASEHSEISERRTTPKEKKKKKKKERRGHSSDVAEVTVPRFMPDATVPMGEPSHEELRAEPSSAMPGRLLSLGDAMPEPAVTAPGGAGVSLADERAAARDFDDDVLPPPVVPHDEPSGAVAMPAAPSDPSLDDGAPPSLEEPVVASAEASDARDAVISEDSAAAPVEEPVVDEPVDDTPKPPTRDDLIARAQTLLQQGGDVDECLAAAVDLQALVPGDPRVMRLAGRALLLSAPTGVLPETGVSLVVKDAVRHGDRAARLIREVQLAMPPLARLDQGDLWLAGARAAENDTDAVHDLLEEVASGDGPDGAFFVTLDDALKDANDIDRRDALHLRAWRAAGDDVERRMALVRGRIALLENARRESAAVAAWAQLVLEHGDAVTATDRNTARRMHEKKATPDERARFLARLARVTTDDGETASVLRELLELRVSVDDKVGAEATARDLLLRVPGDARATTVLADLLSDDPRRAKEVVAALRARADAALKDGDKDGAQKALERLARAYGTLDDSAAAAAALIEAVRLAPQDQPLVERVLDAVFASPGGVEAAVDLLEELADDAVAGASRVLTRDGRTELAGRLFLRAGLLAKEKLQKRGRARELVEKAALHLPKDLRVLDAHADLLLEIGDATAALAVLEKIAGEEKDAAVRARVHLRIGRLLEEHLQRPDDAIKRFRAAVDTDKNCKDAFDALYSLARRKGDRDLIAFSLAGLAALQSGRDRSQTLVKLGKLHAVDRNDPVAAAAAYEAALSSSPSDIDALTGLVQVRAQELQGERDLEAALAVPSPELVDEMRTPLLAAEAQGAELPFSLRRLLALAVTQDGDRDGAHKRFEALLEERGDDLATLLAFARHLSAAGRVPSQAPGAVALADARRREVLEAVLLHHAYALKPSVHVDVWGEVCALRLSQGDVVGAKKAAKKALALITASERPVELEDALSDRAVRAFVLALEDGFAVEGAVVDAADLSAVEQALELDLQRAIAPSEKARLKEKQARLALTTKKDAVLARQLLEEALKHDPDASVAREMLFDLELSGEDPRQVLDQSRALVARERDPAKKATLHLRLFRLQKKLRLSDDVAATEIRAAVELDPRNSEILDAAEKFFTDKKDGKGLDALYTTRLKSLDRNDVTSRLALLERLAQLRRYDLRDLRAAIDACEAMSALDPDAIKPREDAARLHVELGQWKEAVYAWRAVLDRDTLLVEAWRGLFSVYARSRQGDDAFAVAATMAALEIADDDMVRAVRAVRPPFPRWPLPPADVTATKKKVAHPMERTAVRAVLEVVAPRLLPRLGRPLQDFGVRRKDALVEAKLPPSVAMGVRTGGALAGLTSIPLYQAELGATDGASPPFAALPAREPGLIVTGEVLRGGMTPERAFALGRAIAWLSPWALLAAALDAAEIRKLLEALVSVFLSPRDVEKPSAELDRYGAEVQKELYAGLSATDQDALRTALMPALRDWVVARSRTHLSDWKAGVGYSGDRLGFLLCGDLPAAVKIIRSSGGSPMGVRMAIRELVLFTISPQYLQLRKELSLGLPEGALAPILDLG